MKTLFDGDVETKEEKQLRLEKEREAAEAKSQEYDAEREAAKEAVQKERQKFENFQTYLDANKQNFAVVNESTYWMAYCGMQKAIRQGNVKSAVGLAFISWMKNPWNTYKRLHIILLEDIGAGNKSLLQAMSKFFANGRTFKFWGDIQWMVEEMCKSVKTHEADDFCYAWLQDALPWEELQNLLEYKIKHDLGLEENYPGVYETEEYRNYKDILGLCNFIKKHDAGKQIYFTPFLVKYRDDQEKEGKTFPTFNGLIYPCHNQFFAGVMPYTVLDTHGWHGKHTMELAWKKLNEKSPSFVSNYNLTEDLMKEFVFFFEGSAMDVEIAMTNIKQINAWATFNRNQMGAKGKNFDNFAVDFLEEVLTPLKSLRKWLFENRFSKVIAEVDGKIFRLNNALQEMV